MTEPIQTYESATVYYLDDHQAERSTRAEGATVEIYPDWVVIKNPAGTWVPRELVEKVIRL